MAPSVWILALKEFNKGKGEWCVPRKGSPEYNEIKKIMDKLKTKEVKKPNINKKLDPKYKEILNDTLQKFLEINSLLTDNDIKLKSQTNEEFRNIYNNLDTTFITFYNHEFPNINDYKSFIKEFNNEINKYKKILKKLKMIK